MKIKVPMFAKTAFVIALALCSLLTASMHVFATTSEEKDISAYTLAPQVESSGNKTIMDKVIDKAISDGTTPPSFKDYSEKFNVYTHVTTEGDQRIATVYTLEQVQAIKRNKWNVLATDEALYLLDDTMKLFANYDIVRVTNINGLVESYYGMSFYTSDAYYDSFSLNANDGISYDLKADVYNAMLSRLEVLSSASVRRSISGHGNEGFIFLGRGEAGTGDLVLDSHYVHGYYSNPHGFVLPEENETDNIFWCDHCNAYDYDFGDKLLNNNYRSWLNCRDAMADREYGVVWFEQERIFYVADLSRANYRDVIKLYPDELFDSTVGNLKYDANTEKVVVIEVWETETQSCVARLRLDDSKNPEEIAQIEALWLQVRKNIGSAPDGGSNTDTDYRVAVYMNGLQGEWGDLGFVYAADGDLDYWALNPANGPFWPLGLSGTSDIAAYINTILAELCQK